MRTGHHRRHTAAAALCALAATSCFAAACTGPHILGHPPPIGGVSPSATAANPTPPKAPSAQPTAAEAESPRPNPPAAPRYAVSAEHPVVAKLAMEVLARGGSAADAAVVALLSGGVAQPVSSGLGGGGLLLYWDNKQQKVTVLDFLPTAPIGLRPNDFHARPPRYRQRGVMVGVPGEIAGLKELHKRWGKLGFRTLFAPAIALAREGVAISPHMNRALHWNRGWLKRSTPARTLFAPGAKPLKTGDRARNPALGRTLATIASEGPAAFYQGTIARDILATAARRNSPLSEQDLIGYEVLERAPLKVPYANHTVYTAPPPSAGGLLLAETLLMHRPEQLAQFGPGTGAYLHLLAETFRGAIADRLRAIGDPAFIKMDIPALLAAPRLNARRQTISLEHTRKAESFPFADSGTSHFVAIDTQGNAISITSSLGGMFGARLLTQSGFPLNSQLNAFSPERLLRQYKVGQLRPNAPRGGARPVTSMTPTLVLNDNKISMALGGSGGTRIATGVTQVLLAQLVFHQSARQAVTSPRIDTPPGGGLRIDPHPAPELAEDLRRRGELVLDRVPNYSAIQLISAEHPPDKNALQAVADPRKGGAAYQR